MHRFVFSIRGIDVTGGGETDTELERWMNSHGCSSIKLLVFSRFILQYVRISTTRWPIGGRVCLNHLDPFTIRLIISFAMFHWFSSSVSSNYLRWGGYVTASIYVGFEQDNLKSQELSLLAFSGNVNAWMINFLWSSGFHWVFDLRSSDDQRPRSEARSLWS